MGNELKAPVRNKFLLTQQNLEDLERIVLSYSGLPESWFRRLSVPTSSFQQEPVLTRTIFVSESNILTNCKEEKLHLLEGINL